MSFLSKSAPLPFVPSLFFERKTTQTKLHHKTNIYAFQLPKGWTRRLHFEVFYFCSRYKEDEYVDIDLLCKHLMHYGYNVRVCDSKCQDKKIDKMKIFSRLNHSFLVVIHNDYFGIQCIVDPNFGLQFIISRPTKRYQNVLKNVPHIFVGTWSCLVYGVSVICSEIKKSFEENKLTLPPWRTEKSILSKWRPIIHKDVFSDLEEIAK